MASTSPLPAGGARAQAVGAVPTGDKPGTAAALAPAPHGRRLLAHALDLLVFAALSFPPVFVWTLAEVGYFSGRTVGLRALEITLALLYLLYFVSLWRLTGTSPGKRLMRLRVVGPDGGHPGLVRALVRWTVMALLGIPLGLTWWTVLLRHDRRAIHDWLAGTRVVGY